MSETPDHDRARTLVRALLWDACEIEQQLMIQYLFAAFTLKREPDATCTPAQFEYVRRWYSQIMVVARQEMEHLALANGILTALAEDPFFGRENLPIQPRYFLGLERARDHSPRRLEAGASSPEEHTPCDIPFVFERFNQKTIERFVCAESPSWEYLKEPYVATWCFSDGDCRKTRLSDWEKGGLRAAAGAGDGGGLRLGRTHVAREELLVAGEHGHKGRTVHPGSIQELYDRIARLLTDNPGLFRGNPAQQVFVPVEYQISILPVTDLASALLAIRQIVEEGEGIDEGPDYESHYTRFFDIRNELIELQRRDHRFCPSLPVMKNPSSDHISVDYTLRVFHLFNHAYATLLYMLTSLYRNFSAGESSYPFLGTALQSVAFGPWMTMVVRPIAEVLVSLRAEKRGKETAGPNFHLSPEDERLIWPRGPHAVQLPGELGPGEQASQASELSQIDFFLDRMAWLVEELTALSTERKLGTHLLHKDREEWARRQLHFVRENTLAITNNTRRIYQIGELPQFVVPS
jgi:hypothetical protein